MKMEMRTGRQIAVGFVVAILALVLIEVFLVPHTSPETQRLGSNKVMVHPDGKLVLYKWVVVGKIRDFYTITYSGGVVKCEELLSNQKKPFGKDGKASFTVSFSDKIDVEKDGDNIIVTWSWPLCRS